jgi:hypothetical protein
MLTYGHFAYFKIKINLNNSKDYTTQKYIQENSFAFIFTYLLHKCLKKLFKLSRSTLDKLKQTI